MSMYSSYISERLEAAVVKALHGEAPEELRKQLGLRLERVGSSLVSMAANDPSILLNRSIGIGLDQAATEEEVEAICALYREVGVDRFFLQVHPEARPDNIEVLLQENGLKSYRRWMKFERHGATVPSLETDLDVRKIDGEYVDDFGRIAGAGFGLTPQAAPLFRGLLNRDEFHLYMTFDGARPAGTGLLFTDGDSAWLDWAATDREFRKRGSQRALLARRITDALDAGCSRLMTCTGEAVPGDPQHSYHNIEWAGFESKFLRENWIPS